MKLHKTNRLNFFSLACILSASAGFPFIIFGNLITKDHNSGVAIGSLIVGNLILWLVGITIISMTREEHVNGIQNIKNYIGKLGTLIVASIFIFSFLNWFAFHITDTVESIQDVLQNDFTFKKGVAIRIGTVIGLIAALFSIGGIRFLSKLSMITLPLMLLYYIYSFLQSSFSFSDLSLGISFSAVVAVVLAFLPGMINLPTIFRHSRSQADSYFGLTCFTLFITFIECTSIWLNDPKKGILIIGKIHNSIGSFESILLILMIAICNGLMNIYFASACYETFSPHFSETKGYAIIGLLGTAVYAFVQISPPLKLFLSLFNGYLTSLATVLLISFLIRIMVKHRPRNLEKWINFSAWVVGCIGATLSKLSHPSDETNFLLVGIASSLIYFLIVIFLEETIWAINQIRHKKSTN